MGGVTGNLFHHLLDLCRVFHPVQLKVFIYLVAESLGSNDGDLITDSLVGLEIESQLWVISLDNDLGGLLNSLGTNATHDYGIEGVVCGGCRKFLRLSIERYKIFKILLCGKSCRCLASCCTSVD